MPCPSPVDHSSTRCVSPSSIHHRCGEGPARLIPRAWQQVHVVRAVELGLTLEDVKQQLGHSTVVLTSCTGEAPRQVATAMDAVLGV